MLTTWVNLLGLGTVALTTNHSEKLGFSRSWEMGEGSGTHDSSKKTVPVSKCSGEAGGALPRADGGSNVAVGARNTSVGSPSSDTDMGLAVPDETAIDDLSRGCLINGLEEGVRVSTSYGNSGLTEPVDSSIVGSPTSQLQSLLSNMH